MGSGRGWDRLPEGGAANRHADFGLAGSLRDGDCPSPNPAGRKVAVPIDLVTLAVDTRSLSLTDLVRHMREFIASLEAALLNSFASISAGAGASDAVIAVDMEFFEPDAESTS